MIQSKRGRVGGKKMDMAAQRAALGQQQMTACLAVVRLFPGESSHFEISTENGSHEILVDVEMIPSGTRTLARLGFGSAGMYRIPSVGQEVALLIPYDSSSLIKDPTDYEAIIVGALDLNAPSQLVDPNTLVLSAPNVIILSDNITLAAADGSGNDPIARKSDVEAIRSGLNSLQSTYSTHGHTGVTTGSGTSGAPVTPGSSTPAPSYSANSKVK